ncbi:hypothetical protein [Yoonia sp. R2-816]|uniref:hypothetical protein n=1 Tax=Yoonia sp. R2-816 TaxID=3342638 RepID=UPI00372D6841
MAKVRDGPSIPSSTNVSAVAFRTMHGISRSIFAASLAALIFVKHFGFEAVATIFATEADAFSHM